MSEGEGGPGSEKYELEEHPLVRGLISDPAAPPDCRVFVGFLGRAATAGRWRLYRNAELTSFIEFEAGDLRYSTTIREQGLPRSVVWIHREAQIQEVTSRTAESAFLQGPITDDLLAGSVGDEAAEAALIGTIIRTISRLLCSRVCPSRAVCPDTNLTICQPGSCLVCAAQG